MLSLEPEGFFHRHRYQRNGVLGGVGGGQEYGKDLRLWKDHNDGKRNNLSVGLTERSKVTGRTRERAPGLGEAGS